LIVKNGKSRSSIGEVARTLRDIAMSSPEDALLGSEDDLVETLGVSRATVRQAARLLERDGVLRVRRGIKGGYFAARPNVEMVEAVFCAYLKTLGFDAAHSGAVTTGLWIESLRQAAGADRIAALALAERFSERIEQFPVETPLAGVTKLEQEIRSAVLQLIGGGYIEILFRINAEFARQQLGPEVGELAHRYESTDPEGHRRFVQRWKKAKLMELEAIASGDGSLAMMAALHNRKLWISRGSSKERLSAGLPS
jgi:DNA-binding GntR family transcriptional regulator